MAGVTNVKHHGFNNDAAKVVVAFLVGLLLLAGAAFAYEGLGLDLGLLGRVASKPDALPIGLGLWVLAVLIARFSIFGRSGVASARHRGGIRGQTRCGSRNRVLPRLGCPPRN